MTRFRFKGFALFRRSQPFRAPLATGCVEQAAATKSNECAEPKEHSHHRPPDSLAAGSIAGAAGDAEPAFVGGGILRRLLVLGAACLVCASRPAQATELAAPKVAAQTEISRVSGALLGTKPAEKPKPAEPKRAAGRKRSTAADELRAFYGDQNKPSVAPPRERTAPVAERVEQTRDPAEVQRAVGEHQKAFRMCIETELKKHPAFLGGKIHLIATLGPSGSVTRASIDRSEVDRSDLGTCLKNAAKRMAFPAAEAETDVEIPFILAGG
jgi:hypothetical protein